MFHHRFITRVVTAMAIAVILGWASVSAGASIASTGKCNVADRSSNALSTTAGNTAVPLALSIAPAIVVGGNQTTATITISTAAPAGGTEITLSSLNSEVARFGGTFAAIGTSQLRIPEGSVSATFPVRTFGVVNRTDVTLQARSGADVASATVTVNPASVRTLAIAPVRVVGGVSATGTVTIDGLAPASAGVTVQLSVVGMAFSRTGATNASNNSSPASVPSSVTIAPGASSATFAINTTPVLADAAVTVSAARASNGSIFIGSGTPDGTSTTIVVGGTTAPAVTAALTISAPIVSSLLLNPRSVPGGTSSTGTVVLTGKAPSNGFVLGLSAGSRDASVPISVTVPAGADRQDFPITTRTASSSQTVTIKVFARPSDGSIRSIPDGTSNTIAIGESTAPVVAADLSITPTPPPLTIAAQPSPVTGGAPVAITLTVQPVSTFSSQPGSVALTTDHPELLQLPPTVSIPTQSQTTAGPQIVIINAPTTSASADQNVTITATGFSSSASTALLIKQTPPPIASFTLRGTTVTGGLNIIAQFTLSSTAPNSVTVSLTTDHPELVTVPATVTVTRSAIPNTLTFRTAATTVPTTVTITASTGTQTMSTTISIVP